MSKPLNMAVIACILLLKWLLHLESVTVLPHGRLPGKPIEEWEYWVGRITNICAPLGTPDVRLYPLPTVLTDNPCRQNRKMYELKLNGITMLRTRRIPSNHCESP